MNFEEKYVRKIRDEFLKRNTYNFEEKYNGHTPPLVASSSPRSILWLHKLRLLSLLVHNFQPCVSDLANFIEPVINQILILETKNEVLGKKVAPKTVQKNCFWELVAPKTVQKKKSVSTSKIESKSAITVNKTYSE